MASRKRQLEMERAGQEVKDGRWVLEVRPEGLASTLIRRIRSWLSTGRKAVASRDRYTISLLPSSQLLFCPNHGPLQPNAAILDRQRQLVDLLERPDDSLVQSSSSVTQLREQQPRVSRDGT